MATAHSAQYSLLTGRHVSALVVCRQEQVHTALTTHLAAESEELAHGLTGLVALQGQVPCCREVGSGVGLKVHLRICTRAHCSASPSYTYNMS